MSTEHLQYLTPAQTADHLGVSIRTVYALLRRGEIESVKIGASRRIPARALADFEDRLEATASAS